MLVSALAALLLYVPGLGGGFVWDDHLLVEQNPLLRSSAGISRALSADFWAASGGANSSGIWRPLITLSYAIDGALGHWHPGFFHVANAIAHAGASALVTALALGTGASALVAGLAGILFAALPAHAESVAWISGRTDVYCALFFLLALVLDRRARAAGRRWPGVGPLLALALALLSKETALAFFPVAAVAEWIGTRGRRLDLRSSAIWLAPYAALSALHLLAHQAWVRAPEANAVLVPARQGLRAVALMFPGYLAFAWPWFEHTPAVTLEPTRASAAAVAGALAAHLAFLAALAVLLRRRAVAALPLALFWLATLPTMVVDLAHGYYLYAERFFYLPSAGLAWAAAAGTESLRGSRRLRIAAIAAIVILAGGSAFALERALPEWRDDLTLFGSMVRHAPRNYMARTQWARQLALAGRDDEAARQVEAAQAIDPARPEAPSVASYLAFRRADWAGALAAADRAIERGDIDLEPHLLRIASLFSLGRIEEGRVSLEALRRRTPGQPAVESLWGQYLLQYGRRGEAYPVLARVMSLLPQDPDVAFKFGLAAAEAGHAAEARASLERAVALDATRYDAWLELARVRSEQGDRAGAEAALARAQALPGAADGRAAALRARLANPR